MSDKIKIGFNVNGVLRNFIDSFINNYEVRYADENNPVHEFINKSDESEEYQTKEYATEDVIRELILSNEKLKQEELYKDREGEERPFIEVDTLYNEAVGGTSELYKVNMISRFINEPPNPYDIFGSFGFGSSEELSKFLFEDFVIEIFGSSDEVFKNSIFAFNRIVKALSEEKNIESLIITKELGRVRAATLFFLSNKTCEADTIRFVEKDEEYWSHVDILVTDNPNLLNNVPEGKKTIKIKTDFNKECKSDVEIDTILELMDERLDETLNKLKLN